MNHQWFLFLSTTLASLVNLILPLVLVRILSPQQVGEYKIFFLYLQSVPSLFFASGIMSGIPIWSTRKENGKVYLQQAFSILILIIFLFMFLGLISFYPLKALGITSSFAMVFLFSSMLWMLSPFFEEVLIAENRLVKASALIFISEAVRAICMVSAAIYFKNLNLVLMGFLAALVIKILLGTYWVYPLGVMRFTWIESIKAQVLKFALPLSTATFFSFFIEKSDQIILTFFIPAKEFAAYSLACLTIPPLIMLEQSITRVLMPKLARLQDDTNLMITEYQKAVTNIGLLVIPATIGLVTFSQPIIILLFGKTYEASHWYLKLYAISYLFFIVPHDLFHRAKDKSNWIMKTYFYISPIGLALTFMLTILFKAWGALLALLITKLIFKIVYFLDMKASFYIELNNFFPTKALAYFSLISLILMGISYGTKSFFDSDFRWMVVMGSIFLVGYLACTRKYLHRFRQE